MQAFLALPFLGSSTGVFIGNTCTGEGMRSNSLRLRWPTVQRATLKAAQLQGIPAAGLSSFMKTAESCYKSIFPAMSEDSLPDRSPRPSRAGSA